MIDSCAHCNSKDGFKYTKTFFGCKECGKVTDDGNRKVVKKKPCKCGDV